MHVYEFSLFVKERQKKNLKKKNKKRFHVSLASFPTVIFDIYMKFKMNIYT